MDRSSKVSRPTPMRVAVALLAAGVLSIGAAACGSGSSSDSDQSASVPKREAGFSQGTYLKVTNRESEDITVTICAVGEPPCREQKLARDQSTDMANSSESTPEDVTGNIVYADGTKLDFSAANPNIGYPWIKTWDLSSGRHLLDYEVLPGGNNYNNVTGGCTKCDSFSLYRPVDLGGKLRGLYFVRTADTSDYVQLALSVGRQQP